MENLLLGSFAFFFFAGMLMTVFGPEPTTLNKTQQLASQWKVAKYWFYIMLAHGVIFLIMFLFD